MEFLTNKTMETHKKQNRRKFFRSGLVAAFMAPFGLKLNANTANTGKTVKMLTPDGQLVEVDESKLNSGKRIKASNKEILKWKSTKNH
ncbi:MAG: hypothetical protein OEX02_10155 [Cyclobacteriaceae bacterium]|nr:hypothetical protein [Cyclobacteriaceae bacterium]